MVVMSKLFYAISIYLISQVAICSEVSFQDRVLEIKNNADYQKFAFHEGFLDSENLILSEYFCSVHEVDVLCDVLELEELGEIKTPMVLLYEFLDLGNAIKWNVTNINGTHEIRYYFKSNIEYEFVVSLFDAEGYYSKVIDQKICDVAILSYLEANPELTSRFVQYIISTM
jgi:hypothetical protein